MYELLTEPWFNVEKIQSKINLTGIEPISTYHVKLSFCCESQLETWGVVNKRLIMD